MPAADTPAFRFGQASTRFLGDLYQDLDEDARERFALWQTPDFVESFILDRTLEPAIERFGLEDATLMDPTCGSGHVLLGAFDRLFEHRLRAAPDIGKRRAAELALGAVYGVEAIVQLRCIEANGDWTTSSCSCTIACAPTRKAMLHDSVCNPRRPPTFPPYPRRRDMGRSAPVLDRVDGRQLTVKIGCATLRERWPPSAFVGRPSGAWVADDDPHERPFVRRIPIATDNSDATRNRTAAAEGSNDLMGYIDDSIRAAGCRK